MALSRAAFDCHVLPLDETGFAQSLQERTAGRRREDSEDADHRHRLLLRASPWRHRHRTAKKEQQLAPSHWVTFVAGRCSHPVPVDRPTLSLGFRSATRYLI